MIRSHLISCSINSRRKLSSSLSSLTNITTKRRTIVNNWIYDQSTSNATSILNSSLSSLLSSSSATSTTRHLCSHNKPSSFLPLTSLSCCQVIGHDDENPNRKEKSSSYRISSPPKQQHQWKNCITQPIRSSHHFDIKTIHNHSIYHSQRRYKSVFVSKHNSSMNLSAKDIITFLSNNAIISSNTSSYKTTAGHVIVKECPFCIKPTHDKPDNEYKLYVSVGNGMYFCHRCGTSGSWYDMKMRLGSNQNGCNGSSNGTGDGGNYNGQNRSNGSFSATSSSALSHNNHNKQQVIANSNSSTDHDNGLQNYIDRKPTFQITKPLPMPQSRLSGIYSYQLLDRKQQDDNNNKCLDYLVEERGFDIHTLRRYGVGMAMYKFPDSNIPGKWIDTECITFPWIMNVKDIEYQEELRGSKFYWDIPTTSTEASTTTTTESLPTTPATTTMTEEDPKIASSSLSSSDTETKKKKPRRGRPRKSVSSNQDEDQSKSSSSSPDLETMKKTTYLTRRIKVRSVENKAWQRMDPPGGGWGLFGYHTIPSDAKEIIITEGEYDAMAVYQSTKRSAISLPNGCRSLPVEVLPLLEQYDKIYLWMDNDGPGREGAEQFAKKIGVERCYIVRPTKDNCKYIDGFFDDDDDTTNDIDYNNDILIPKDANEALLYGIDMNIILNDSKILPHEQIVNFSDLRSDVIHEIMFPDKYVGIPFTTLPGLTKIIKGFRRGEMTVLTGPTGSGKTTYLGQMSLDLAEQDVNVLWGSFEIKNTRLMHKLLQQFARQPIIPNDNDNNTASIDPDKLQSIADQFQTLPMHFMKFHGGSDVDDVIDAMEYAVYVNDVEHVILDNMQFMVSRQSSTSNRNNPFDKFDVQDIAIEKFRHFATRNNIHITLVVHPRKEQENTYLSMSSVYGSAKATQEADIVLILQNDGRKKFLEVKKNRFNGTLGYIPLHYDPMSCRYNEQPTINGIIKPIASTGSMYDNRDNTNHDDYDDISSKHSYSKSNKNKNNEIYTASTNAPQVRQEPLVLQNQPSRYQTS